MKVLLFPIAFIGIMISYLIFLLIKINKGFYEGYFRTELNLNIIDYSCFYYNISYSDIIKVANEAQFIKYYNFNKETVNDAWELLKLLNRIKKQLNFCLIRISKMEKKEKDVYDNTLSMMKKIGDKLIEFVPLGEQIKKGYASIELALEFKSMILQINEFNNFSIFKV